MYITGYLEFLLMKFKDFQDFHDPQQNLILCLEPMEL